MKYILQNKLLFGTIVLGIWAVVSILMLSSDKKKIESKNYEISELEENVYELENRVSELESEKGELETQISELESNIIWNRANYYYNNNSRQYSSTFNGNEIDEREAYSAQGQATVVFRKRGCDFMILENSSGYIVVEWMGGNDPDQGDIIGGNLNSYGTKEFYNLSTNSETKLWIDDYMLSKDRALEKINDKCN